jgi:hypothetical protein
MATAPKLPAGEQAEAVEILRRLEPMLTGIVAEQRRQGEAIAELRGKVSALPTIWQIIGPLTAINGAIIALGFALARLVVRA